MSIRRTPRDFRVEEVLTEEFLARVRPGRTRAARHALFALTKESLTTEHAARALARALGVRPGRVRHAGLKDKHASTVQHFTVEAEAIPDPGSGVVGGRGWDARFLGWSPEPLSAKAIARNRFAITIRALTEDASREMDRRTALLADDAPESNPSDIRHLLIVNFFGPQRFGSARHGQGFAARRLIEGDFDGALRLLIATPARKDSGLRRTFTRLAAAHWGDWARLARELPRCPERGPVEVLGAGGAAREAFAALPRFVQQMCVDAYQSELWNRMAARVAADFGLGILDFGSEEETARAGDERAASSSSQSKIQNPKSRIDVFKIRLPMLAPETIPARPWGEHALAVLAEEGLTLARLRIPGLRRPAFQHSMRPLLVHAAAFALSPPEPDELATGAPRLKRTASFDLPAGSYATVVLRALGQ